MCNPPLPLYHTPAASANMLIQIRVQGNPLKAASDGPSWHKAFWQPRGTMASLFPGPTASLYRSAAPRGDSN